MKKILVLILLGVITILTPLSFKANYYSIDQPVIDLNNHTLNEVFTDTINELDQYKITSILDLQIYEGLSLRDIFETNNLVLNPYFNDTSIWVKTAQVLIENGFASIISTDGSYQKLEIPNLTTIGNNYYLYLDYINNLGNIKLANPSTNIANNSYIYTADNIHFTLARNETPTDVDVDNIFLIPMSIFTTAPSQLQLDEWLSFYLDPSTIASFDTVGDIEVYKVGDGFYNLTAMKTDQVYSTFNLDTFDNLLDAEITDQFGAWQTLGIEDIEVLSLTEFQTFAPALDQEDMLYWFNYHNLILEYDEVQAGILSDLEITILIIALVLFIIGIALAIYFHHKIMFFVTGLLWFVPIVIVPNIFIITFSVIMIIIFGLLAFYNSQGKDFD